MLKVWYVIPILLAVTIPNAFAEVGQNYDTITNDDGSTTWTSHAPRIMDGTWQNYFLETDEQKIIFKSNSIGGLTFDIPSCSYSLYENGFDGNQIIPSVSIVGTHNNNGTWENLAVNEESCKVDFSQDEKGITITSTKENTTQKLTQEIIVNINIGIKETFKLWDESGNPLGISQTVHTGEFITIAEQTIDIAQYNGQSFDRSFIVDNKAEILQVANNLNYDFSKGIKSLTNVNIIFEDNTYKVNMDYANGLEGVPFTNYLEIDPTFSASANYKGSYKTSSGSYYNKTNGEFGYNNYDILRSGFYWDISSIPNNAIISDVDISWDITGLWMSYSTFTCKINSIENTLSTMSVQDRYIDIGDGTSFGTISCNSVGTKNMDLGSNADSDLTSELSVDDEWGIGFVSNDETTGQGGSMNLNTVSLTATYSIPTVPSAISDLSASFNSGNVDLSFSTPSDGGSAITSFKVYRDTGSGYSLYDTVSGSSLTSYQDTNPTLGAVNYYKVNAVNSVGEASDSNVASVTAGTPPGNPTGLTSTIQDADKAPLDVY